ncbi:MAG: hypothetical protein ABFC95_03240, partial [Smithella sp.]
MIRRLIFLTLAAALLIRIGYVYVEVGKGVAEKTDESPTIFYGRPLEIQKGDHLGNLRFVERLNKLSYKQVLEKPSTPGTFSSKPSHIRIFLRDRQTENRLQTNGPVEIALQNGRVVSLASSEGKALETIRLEPQ